MGLEEVKCQVGMLCMLYFLPYKLLLNYSLPLFTALQGLGKHCKDLSSSRRAPACLRGLLRSESSAMQTRVVLRSAFRSGREGRFHWLCSHLTAERPRAPPTTAEFQHPDQESSGRNFRAKTDLKNWGQDPNSLLLLLMMLTIQSCSTFGDPNS